MAESELIQILQIVIWPGVAITGILVLRPHFAALFSGSKVKVSVFGLSIETTLPELERIIEEQTGGDALTPTEAQFLEGLFEHGPRDYSEAMNHEEHMLLRHLRNYGLVMTIPRHVILKQAKSVQLTSLGRLYMKARRKQHGPER